MAVSEPDPWAWPKMSAQAIGAFTLAGVLLLATLTSFGVDLSASAGYVSLAGFATTAACAALSGLAFSSGNTGHTAGFGAGLLGIGFLFLTVMAGVVTVLFGVMYLILNVMG